MPRETYTTLEAEFRHEIDKIKGSRFIASLAPARDEAAAEAFLDRVRREFPDARHHCFAWRLGADGGRFRSSDDGEPSGSAGKPILMQLEGHELSDLVCVVTRWFGGTKLGVGGLMRAYGGAAGMACDRAPLREVTITRTVQVTHPYECSGAVKGLLSQFELEPLDAQYDAEVRFRLEVPIGRLEEFLVELSDRTAGRSSADPGPSA